MAAPPATWQRDLAAPPGGAASSSGAQDADTRSSPTASDEAISETWRHIKHVGRQVHKEHDLLDMLQNTGQEPYQKPELGWPSMLRPVSPVMTDLPSMVQDKYRTCQTMCFCGVFPEIRRAWASIDNSLFLWRFDRSKDVPVEYCGEEQAISCVALVKPKPGVFLEAIQHVLVLATTVEIVLLGVCISPGKRGGDAYEELSLQPMPLYAMPSDNVVTTCVASSANGRIFLGGSDGHVYELQYSAQDTWRKRRVAKVRLTGGLQQLLPSFLPGFLFGAPVPIESIVVDNERNIMYTLAQNSAIQVFDLGASGNDTPRKAAEISEFLEAASRAPSGSGQPVFRLGSDKRGAAVKYITPISSSESRKVQLLAVTADGRRLYMSVYSVRPSYYGSSSSSSYGSEQQQGSRAQPRPVALTAMYARHALPQDTGSGRATDLAGGRPLEVLAAHYSDGTLLLSEAAGSGKTTKLLMATRNLTLAPATTNTGLSSNVPGLREVVAELENHIPGETTAMAAIPRRSLLGDDASSSTAFQDELFTELFVSPQRFVLISTAGVLELEKRRPVDMLQSILQERDANKLKHFFAAYGPAEAAAMCYILATSDLVNLPARVAEEATAALDNPALVGEPHMPEDTAAGRQEAAAPGGASGIFMGQAVNPNPEPEWSGAHHGLCVYISRLLLPAWERRLVTSSGGTKPLHFRISAETMQALERQLRALDAFLADFMSRRKSRGYSRTYAPTTQPLYVGYADENASRGPGSSNMALTAGGSGQADAPVAKRQRMWNAFVMEEQRNAAVRALGSKTAQALLLLRTLAANNINRLAKRLDSSSQRQLRELTLRDLVFDPQGQRLATSLISVLVSDQLDAGGSGGGAAGVDDLAGALQAGAPSYFRDQDRQFYQATAKLKQAEEAGSPSEKERLAKEAVSQLLKVPQCVNLEQMVPRLAYLKQYEGIVDMCLRSAALRDPESVAWRPGAGADQQAARQAREACYQPLLQVLRAVVTGAEPLPAAPGGPEPPDGGMLPAADRRQAKDAILKSAARSLDQYFHKVLYSTLVDLGATADLLGLDSRYLETYLSEEGGLNGNVAFGAQIGPLSRRQALHLDLLCRLLIRRGQYHTAAQVYRALGERRSGPGEAAVSLEQRLEAFQNGQLQARSAGEISLADSLRGNSRLTNLQITIAQRLQQRIAAASAAAAAAPGPSSRPNGDDGGDGVVAQLKGQLEEVSSECRDISDLYNSYAQPNEMWDVCLEICDFAGQVPANYVAQLWDLTLKQAWEEGRERGGAAVGLEEACTRMEALGGKFYPNEASFPIAHVALRLEQIAAGLWPTDAATNEPHPDPSRAVRALRAACSRALGGAGAAVLAVYEALLSKRVAGIADGELASAPMRLQLLRSLAALCNVCVDEDLGSSLPSQPDFGYPSRYLGRARQTSALLDIAELGTQEAQRLGGPQGQQLQAEFDRVRRRLEEYA